MTFARSTAIVAGVAAVTAVALPPGLTARSPAPVKNDESYCVIGTSESDDAVNSSQAVVAPGRPVDLSATRSALWLSATTLLALLVIYFVGIDQGAVSMFGGDMHVHEFTHDARD